MTEPILHIEAWKSFGGLKVLDGCTLDVYREEVLTLIGPNGAGKTTLFNLITGHLRIDRGTIVYDGKELAGRAPDEVARLGIGRSFQDLRLFTELSVLDNVMVSVPTTLDHPTDVIFRPRAVRGEARRIREHAEGVLEQVGLAAIAGQRVGSISYAEQKFLSLARLIASDTELWLLDEPTSGIDWQAAQRMFALVRQHLAARRTVLLVEHNMDVVRVLGHRAAFLDAGRVISVGTPEEVMSNPDLTLRYFGKRRKPRA